MDNFFWFLVMAMIFANVFMFAAFAVGGDNLGDGGDD
jgi:hypothetical protein